MLAVQAATWYSFVTSLVGSLVWPAFALVVLLYLAKSETAPDRIRALFGPFKRVKLWGAELELSEKGARKLRESAKETFKEFRLDVQSEFDDQVRLRHLNERLARVANDVQAFLVRTATSKEPLDFRCTIHIEDVLFAETLYQLLDYYPDGEGRGRTWSTRRGIIGQAWRLNESVTQGRVAPDPTVLISNWGMTLREALKASRGQRRSFSAVVLIDSQAVPVAIFYMDSQQQDAFGPDSDEAASAALHEAVRTACDGAGLTPSLVEMSSDLRAKGPVLPIYDGLS